ncbi:methyltransferase domain-containing protein [Friedmanniella luteola]|uniref:methyltransferase domain-containing protein n=1 Tax=Friedmanniella luteola TaxID=546871 RepID=UPI001560DEBF|nr:methyltransferase domain-containing protein [Friedmanniella luteola]
MHGTPLSRPPPGPRGVFRPSAREEPTVAFMVMLLDLQDRDRSIRRLRDWAVAGAGVGPGLRVVDVGSGTGTMAQELASLVGPSGHVTAVEPNPALRGLAEERAAEAGSPAVFVDGLADALPLADGSVDVVWCERVLQHLDDPQAAVREHARVLAPGGCAVLLDSDHDTRVIAAVSPAVGRALNDAFLRGVTSPRVGRTIPELVVRAGLELDPDVGAAVLVMPPATLRDAPFLQQMGAMALADGSLTEAELDAALAAMTVAADEGWAFSAVTIFGFLGRRPLA